MSGTNETIMVEYDLKVIKCPCGSGKKPEKCCGPAKPRTYSVELDIRNYYESDGLAIGLDHQLYRVVNGKHLPLIGRAKFTQSYKRKKNNKVIVKGDTGEQYVLHPESLLQGYESIFAIDTNTQDIDGSTVSMSGIVHAYTETDGDATTLWYMPLTINEFWDATEKPELLGWYVLIKSIMENDEFSNKKTGIIVDSELGRFDRFNSRSEPIMGSFYLPKEFTLIYASSDTSSNIANKLLKQCDRLATMKLNEVTVDARKSSLKRTPYPCMWFRQWTHSN